MIGLIDIPDLGKYRVRYDHPRQVRICRAEDETAQCPCNPADFWRWWDCETAALRPHFYWLRLESATDDQVEEFRQQLGLLLYSQAAEATAALTRAVLALVDPACSTAVAAQARRDGCDPVQAIVRNSSGWCAVLSDSNRHAVACELSLLVGRLRLSGWVHDFERYSEGGTERLRKRFPGKVKNQLHGA